MKKRETLMRNIAHERIILLLNMAFERARKGDFDLARRYVEIALRIAGKAKIKIPVKYKRNYCRKCLIPLIPGLTLRIRIHSEGKGSRVVYRCLLCGWTRRFMIKTSRKKSRRELRGK
ncbi:MAG: ribonuclease P protein component 4 [Desulfurococcaceae archaeon]